MAKLKSGAKAKAQAGTARPSPRSAEGISRSIMDSAQQVWLAGVGAFGRAQEEGSKLFEALVKEGMTLEQKTRQLATGRVDAVRGAVENGVGQVRERAADTWDRLEKVFEDRVQRSLHRLGVPSRDELQALIARVDELNRELRKLGGTPTAAKTAKPAAARTAKKPARPAAPRPASAVRPRPAKPRGSAA